MELRKILSSNDPLLDRLPELYESAFPPIARILTRGLLEVIDEHNAMTMYAIVDDGVFGGMVVAWDLERYCYLEYFAIVPEWRNRGIGAKVLEELHRIVDVPIVGETEPPVSDLQKRRIAFYLRNGFIVVCENPHILNGHHSDNLLYFLSNKPLDDPDGCQRLIIDKVYRVMQAKDAELAKRNQ